VAVNEQARTPGPVVFLDKDGTVIEDVPYNVDPRRIRLAPGAREAIRLLGEADATLVIATNQSGVARGYFTEDDLHTVGRHLGEVFAGLGARLAGFYFCPHVEPGDGVNGYAVICDCRKPEPGLVIAACRDLGLSLDGAWFVGDTWMDVVAGRRAGCRTIMVGPEARTADGLEQERRPDFAVDNLLLAAQIILAHHAGSGRSDESTVGESRREPVEVVR
jgi:histidinol-phosphate phosphatase family protein